MKIISKVLIPNKEWIIETDQGKIGSIAKNKKGYLFLQKGKIVPFKNITDIKQKFGIDLSENKINFKSKSEITGYNIYDYPCNSKPHAPIFNVKKRLPIFSKSIGSKSQYCAGHYVIKFRKGWVSSFCPKLITLERYPYYGPFKNEIDSKNFLNKINNNNHETTQYATN